MGVPQILISLWGGLYAISFFITFLTPLSLNKLPHYFMSHRAAIGNKKRMPLLSLTQKNYICKTA